MRALVVVPHPDDEFSVWGLVQDLPDVAFLLLTRGGASRWCRDNGGRQSEECRRRRVASWEAFLADAGRGEAPRLVLDLPDDGLDAAMVTAALDEAREAFGEPELLVAAGAEGSTRHHPDHAAVHAAVRAAGLPAYGATSRDLADTMAEVDDHADFLACPDGTFNRHYGWLNPPCWPSDEPGFTRTQWYWRIGATRRAERVAGESRVETAVAVSRRAFPDGARVVHLASAADPIDAVGAGALATDGPVLLVPTSPPLPSVVARELRRLAPETVVALGGTRAVSDEVLRQARLA